MGSGREKGGDSRRDFDASIVESSAPPDDDAASCAFLMYRRPFLVRQQLIKGTSGETLSLLACDLFCAFLSPSRRQPYVLESRNVLRECKTGLGDTTWNSGDNRKRENIWLERREDD